MLCEWWCAILARGSPVQILTPAPCIYGHREAASAHQQERMWTTAWSRKREKREALSLIYTKCTHAARRKQCAGERVRPEETAGATLADRCPHTKRTKQSLTHQAWHFHAFVYYMALGIYIFSCLLLEAALSYCVWCFSPCVCVLCCAYMTKNIYCSALFNAPGWKQRRIEKRQSEHWCLRIYNVLGAC